MEIPCNRDLDVSGNMTVEGNASIRGDFTIDGNLAVFQTKETTTINTTVNNYEIIITNDIAEQIECKR